MSLTFRAPVYCDNGVVATPHYLASMAGATVLRQGGNAIDAAIAANATVGVVWPHMCGVGGDLFMLIYSAREQKVVALNASGRSPAATSLERVSEQGLHEIPERSGLAVTVPGVVDGWAQVIARFGTRELGQLLQPAIDYAENGFPISAWLSHAIANKLAAFERYPATMAIYAPNGNVPQPGDRLANRDVANTLRRIADQGREGFYTGEVADRIAGAVRSAGGYMEASDLAECRADWVEPLHTGYRGYDVFEMPPNTQGLTAIQMFNLVEGFDVAASGHNTAATLHRMVEAKRLAFADRDAYVADPAWMRADIAWLASKQYADDRRARIDDRRAMSMVSSGGIRPDGDTIYLCAADRDGNVVSLIQSHFASFGSTITAPGTGVVLHNRGAGFVLEPDHPNALAPRKRPFHTLVPALALQGGKPAVAFGTRGANGQPQTQLQVLTNLVDYRMNPQEAVEVPRWVHGGPSSNHPPDTVVLEARLPEVERVAADLRSRGHQVLVSDDLDLGVGTAQVICVDQQRGALIGGSDPRGDGCAIGW